MGQVLRASGITQRFGDRLVLDGVDLDVPAGSVIGLLGPNGAGKTTLMRILFGVLPPDSGTVEWNGRAATDAHRRSWGYMPQERGLYREMRVLDLLVWIARLHGLDRQTGTARALRLLEQLDLDARGSFTTPPVSIPTTSTAPSSTPTEATSLAPERNAKGRNDEPRPSRREGGRHAGDPSRRQAGAARDAPAEELLVLVATYILAQSSAGTSLGAVLAIFPLTSPVIMPARNSLGDASAAEIVASLAIGVATVVMVLRIGAAVYRRGIVHTGRRMRVREALQGG
jgi:hypothetical protein